MIARIFPYRKEEITIFFFFFSMQLILFISLIKKMQKHMYSRLAYTNSIWSAIFLCVLILQAALIVNPNALCFFFSCLQIIFNYFFFESDFIGSYWFTCQNSKCIQNENWKMCSGDTKTSQRNIIDVAVKLFCIKYITNLVNFK